MNINFTLISQAMAFAMFIWFTVRFVWPPLLRAIENRQKVIAEGLAAGERGQHALELASQRVQQQGIIFNNQYRGHGIEHNKAPRQRLLQHGNACTRSGW